MATARQVISNERKKLTETVIKNIEEKGLNWIKGWSGQGAPHNATTGVEYTRGNKIKLMVAADLNNLKDPRWGTFKQAKDKGWKIKKGAKSIPLEKWIFTKTEKDKLTGKETIVKLENPIPSYFRVFNANDIDGIPPFKDKNIEKLKIDKNDLEFIKDLKKSSECEIFERNQDRAYYSSKEDKIILPLKENFKSTEEYLGTMIHEMAHSTGHSTRLDRKLGNGFGSPEYAKEELRAEMSAIYVQNDLGLDLKTNHIENHSAYIKSWVKALKDDHNEIYRAASDAEKISDRLLSNYRSLEKEKTKELEVEKPKKRVIYPHQQRKKEMTNELSR